MKKEQLSQIIKTARDIMRKDDNLSTDLDRIPQFSWLLFLKCFDDLEQRRALLNKKYKDAIASPYRWRDWAADEDKGKTGDDLIKFVNDELFPYLRELVGEGQNDSRDVIASLFKETFNRMRSGYLLRELVNLVNKINFNLKDDVHTMAHFYESMLKEMRDAAGTNGEFYTPRPVIRFIIEQINPKLGETVYDPAAGTCGFLVEAYQHMLNQVKSAEHLEKLRYKTLFGKEKKPMPFLLGTMNLLLHEMDSPNLVRGNTLSIALKEITDKQRHNIIVTNPPFGGEEEKGILDNFPLDMRTSETTLLFIQFIMRSLKINGRCGIVVPDGILSGKGVAGKIKKDLLENFNLHTIVRLPEGVFSPYTIIPTNILFFEKTGKTKDIWYCEIPGPENTKIYTKTNPLKFESFENCQKLWKSREKTEKSWIIKLNEVIKNDYNLDFKNPNNISEAEHKDPKIFITQFQELNDELMSSIRNIQELISKNGKGNTVEWNIKKISEVVEPMYREENLDPQKTYKILGMRLYNNGLFVREEKTGHEIKSNKMNRVEENDFVYSRLFARKGSFAVVPKELSGSVVSNEFPCFKVNTKLILPKFLLFYFSLPSVWTIVESKCSGTTKASRFRFKEEFFLEMDIPVPRIDIQERLIEIIDQIERIKIMPELIKEKFDNLKFSIISKSFKGELIKK